MSHFSVAALFQDFASHAEELFSQEKPPVQQLRLPSGRSLLLASAAAVGVYGVYRWWRTRDYTVKVNPEAKIAYSPESIRPDSDESLMRPASGQIRIAVRDGNDLAVVGCGVRVSFPSAGDFLVTAAHVIGDSTKEYWMISDSGKVPISINDETLIDVVTDICAIRIPAKDFGIMATKMVKAGVLQSSCPVSIVGCSLRGTHGMLSKVSKSFGLLEYGGTSYKGYSGAPYFSGSIVYGIHTHGGKTNGGWNIQYILAVLRILIRESLEISLPQSTLEHSFRETTQVERRGGHVIFEHKGQFISVEEKEWDEAYNAYKSNKGVRFTAPPPEEERYSRDRKFRGEFYDVDEDFDYDQDVDWSVSSDGDGYESDYHDRYNDTDRQSLNYQRRRSMVKLKENPRRSRGSKRSVESLKDSHRKAPPESSQGPSQSTSGSKSAPSGRPRRRSRLSSASLRRELAPLFAHLNISQPQAPKPEKATSSLPEQKSN